MKFVRSSLLSLVTLCIFITIPASVSAQAIIDVSPAEYDFGDVAVGTEASTIITASNIGTRILTITTMKLTFEDNFQILSSVWPPIELYPLDFAEIEVGFIPLTLGYFSSDLVFQSSDPFNPTVKASLAGMGVEELPPPQWDINDLILFLDEAVDNGTIEGRGKGRAGWAHLKVFRFILWAASDLFEAGFERLGCKALHRAFVRSDGLNNPKDFIVGEDVSILNAMILDVMDLLGCE
jgi:hypothetical protein